MSLSCVVITKDEEEVIAKCLKHLLFCDEILIIDDYSKDKTTKIAYRLGAKIFKRKLNGDFSQQRNFGLRKARCEWVLFVDADEIVNSELQKEILKVIAKDNFSGFYIKRKDYFLGTEIKHGEGGKLKLLRLAKKSCGKWQRKVHETWLVNGKKSCLKNPLLHYPHETLGEFLNQINFYSTLHAESNLEEGKNSSLFKIIFFPIFKFIKSWLFDLGILDGVSGTLYSLMMSLHSFLSWSKLWLLQKRKI